MSQFLSTLSGWTRTEEVNPFDTFGSTALPIGTHLNYHWERCAPINTTLTYEHLVIQNGFVARHMK